MYGAQAYATMAVATESPWGLINRLYEGAISRIDEGRLDKARRIVEEGLIGGLDPAVPFARGMRDTYDVVLAHLTASGSVQTARQMLVTLHEAWLAIKPPAH